MPSVPEIPVHLAERPSSGGLAAPWITSVTAARHYLFGKISEPAAELAAQAVSGMRAAVNSSGGAIRPGVRQALRVLRRTGSLSTLCGLQRLHLPVLSAAKP